MTAVLCMLGIAGVLAYGLGRSHERWIALRHAAVALEEWRIERPWLDGREQHTAQLGGGGYVARHAYGSAIGTSNQLATWAADTGEWAIVRPLLIDDARLEAVDV